MLQLTSRRFLRELDKALGGNNLQYILKCPCIPFFGNQGLHNEIVLGGNGRCSRVMCEGSPYIYYPLTVDHRHYTLYNFLVICNDSRYRTVQSNLAQPVMQLHLVFRACKCQWLWHLGFEGDISSREPCQLSL